MPVHAVTCAHARDYVDWLLITMYGDWYAMMN